MGLEELREIKRKQSVKQYNIQLDMISTLSVNIEYCQDAFDNNYDNFEIIFDNYILISKKIQYNVIEKILYKYKIIKRKWRKDKKEKELIVKWKENPVKETIYKNYGKKFFNDPYILLDIQHFNDKLVDYAEKKYIEIIEKGKDEVIKDVAMRSLV